jgi:membrane-associated phospholipid phosphatase
VAIVAVGLVLLAADPYLMAGYRALVPDWPVLRRVAELLTRALDIPTVAAFGLVYVALCRVQRLRRLGVYAAVMVSQGYFNSLLKKVFGRMRPDDAHHAGQFLGPLWHGSGLSFPGGHAAAAFALATLLSAWHPRWRPAFYAGAVLVALARVHLQRHYVADTYFGAWIGALLAASLVQWLWKPAAPPPPPDA